MIDQELYGNDNRSNQTNDKKELPINPAPEKTASVEIEKDKIERLELPKLSQNRLESSAFARYLLEKDNVVFIDTETTGVGKTDEICELAILNSKKEILFDEMFKPGVPMNPAASAVSGITDDMLRYKPDISQYKDIIDNLLSNKIIVGWNVDFDKRLISQSLSARNLEDTFNKNSMYTDAMIATGKFYDTDIFLKQSEVMNAMNIGTENHRAADDVRDMISVLEKMADWNFDSHYNDIIDFVPEKKALKLKAEREKKAGIVPKDRVPLKKEPKYQKYLNEFNNNKSIDEISKDFTVSKSTVQINLLKAMHYKAMPVTDIMKTPAEIRKKADEALKDLKFEGNDCFTILDDNCRFNFKKYVDFSQKRGINLAHLYEAALLREIKSQNP